MKGIWSQPIFDLIESDTHVKGVIGLAYDKVRSHLDRFAQRLGFNHKKLTLMHISNERGEASLGLVRSIKERPMLSGGTKEQHDVYTGQILSRIKNINLNLLGVKNNKDITDEEIERIFQDNFPEIVQSLYNYLPRVKGAGYRRMSEPGLNALLVILSFTREHNIKSREDLIGAHLLHLTKQTYITIHDPRKWRSTINVFHLIRKKLGLRAKRTSARLPVDALPPKLKLRYQTWRGLAVTGAYSDPELHEKANRAQCPIKPLEEASITQYSNAFLLFLSDLVTAGYNIDDLDITDFMIIRVIPAPDDKTFGDNKTVDDDTTIGNEYIEFLREGQRRETHRKAAGRDSVRFDTTLSAILSIASYNGIFKYHVKFKETYTAHLDTLTRANKKKAIKEWFTAEWLDSNLRRLSPQFEAIVESGSYRDNINDLWQCQFYVWTMVFRNSAIRQQGIRNCRKEWNIYLEDDKRVRFRWREDEIKNDKDFRLTFKMSHVNTFAPLVKDLTTYNNNILPFLETLASNQRVDLNGQFFPRVMVGFKVSTFDDNSRTFASQYTDFSRRYLDFTDIPPEIRSQFTSRFIRGMFSDWLHDDLGMGIEPISRILGDENRTTEQNYLQKHRVDATLSLDAVEAQAAALKESRLREGNLEAGISDASEVLSLRMALRDSLAREQRLIEELIEERAKKNRKRRREKKKKRRNKELDLAL